MMKRMMKMITKRMMNDEFMFTGDKHAVVSFDVPEGTLTLGEDSFRSCNLLATIHLPDSLTTIGRYAFRECRSLTSIVLPASVSAIGRGAFAHCNSITTISLPEGITTIESYIFLDCASLQSVVLPSTVTTISKRAVARCQALVSINIPDSVTTIGDSAFARSGALAYIAIPDSTTIKSNAFFRCTELERIAAEAGLSIEEWGKSNWRKARSLKLRYKMVSCIKRLSLLNYEELDSHLTTIQKPQIVRYCVRFLVEIGEPGLMREIVKYAV
jgi:hypothetical protein